MRSYSIKRGHTPDVAALVKQYFGAEVDMESGCTFVADGIGEVLLKKEETTVLIETRPLPGTRAEYAVIKKWNDFLFDVTGRTTKERKKLWEKEAKKR
jgi:hypothetical protein